MQRLFHTQTIFQAARTVVSNMAEDDSFHGATAKLGDPQAELHKTREKYA
jgi:hypothetical protein